MIGEYYMRNDLEGACEKIMKESYARWTTEDDTVVDDITFILLFLDHDNKWLLFELDMQELLKREHNI